MDFCNNQMADDATARGTLVVRLHGATGLRAADSGGTSDPYVKLKICGTEHRSKSIPDTLAAAPTWDERFDFAARSPSSATTRSR